MSEGYNFLRGRRCFRVLTFIKVLFCLFNCSSIFWASFILDRDVGEITPDLSLLVIVPSQMKPRAGGLDTLDRVDYLKSLRSELSFPEALVVYDFLP